MASCCFLIRSIIFLVDPHLVAQSVGKECCGNFMVTWIELKYRLLFQLILKALTTFLQAPIVGKQLLSLRALFTAKLRLCPKHEICLQPKCSVAFLMLLALSMVIHACLVTSSDHDRSVSFEPCLLCDLQASIKSVGSNSVSSILDQYNG